MPKRQRTRRRTRGGAFVRKGSYGCAFAKPPLKCKGEVARRPSNELSKLLEYTKAKEEYQESVPFQRIDPQKRYFLWAHHMCPLDLADVRPDNRIDKCIQPNRGTSYPTVNARKDPTLIFYDFGGKDISDIVISSGQYGPFFLSFGNLLEGLAVMHANRIAHLDIKPLNIVSMELPSGEFSTRFIDFGLAVSTAKGTSTNPRILGLSPQNYPWWPFDFRFLSRTNSNLTSNELRIWYTQLQGLQAYYPQSSYWREDWTPRYNSVLTQEIMNQVPWEFREEILREVDVYALGVSLTEVYASKTGHFMRTYGGKDTIVVQLPSRRVVLVDALVAADLGGDSALVVWHKNLAKTVSLPFFAMIKGMITMDPTKRFQAYEASRWFDTNLSVPIYEFFSKMDTFTSRALAAVGIRVQNTPMKLKVSPALPPEPPAPTAPTATAPAPVSAPAPLPISAPASAAAPATQLQNVLRKAEEALGISAPTSAEKPVSTAGSDPKVSGLAPSSNLKIRTFGKMNRHALAQAQPYQPWQPVVLPNPVPVPKPVSGNRHGLAGPQRTGLNVLRKLAAPQQGQIKGNPLYVAKNIPVKQNKTRKFRFPWEKA